MYGERDLWPVEHTDSAPEGKPNYSGERSPTQVERFFGVELDADFAFSLLDFTFNRYQADQASGMMSFGYLQEKQRIPNLRLNNAAQLEQLFDVQPEPLAEWIRTKQAWAESVLTQIEESETAGNPHYPYPKEWLEDVTLYGNVLNGCSPLCSRVPEDRATNGWLQRFARADWGLANRYGIVVDTLLANGGLLGDLLQKLSEEDPGEIIRAMGSEGFNFDALDADSLNQQLNHGGNLFGYIVLNHEKFPHLELSPERFNELIDRMIELAKATLDDRDDAPKSWRERERYLTNINYLLQIAHVYEFRRANLLNEELLVKLLEAERDCHVKDPIHLFYEMHPRETLSREEIPGMIHAFDGFFGIETFKAVLDRLKATDQSDRPFVNLRQHILTLWPLFNTHNKEESFLDAIREAAPDEPEDSYRGFVTLVDQLSPLSELFEALGHANRVRKDFN
jgi:hypothetical protein